MKSFLGVLVLIALYGCSTGHIYSAEGQCLTCFNNPFTGEAVNHQNNPETNNNAQLSASSQSEMNTKAEEYCINRVNYNMDIPVDVDVAYVRYKKVFGFLTKNERLRSSGYDPDTINPAYDLMEKGFIHDMHQGVRYQMQDAINLNNQPHAGWLMLELEKAGIEKTRVVVSFCEGGIDGFDPQLTKVIRNRVETGYL